MSKCLADLKLVFYSCDMRKRNQYYISQENFRVNKAVYKTILGERRFEILKMRVEKDMSYKDIADIYDISATRVNQIIAHACYLIQKAGYKIDGYLE